MTPLGPMVAFPLVILFIIVLLLLNALIFRAACAIWGVDEPAIPAAAGIVLVAGVVGTVVDLVVSAGLGRHAGDSIGTLVLRVAINAVVTAAIYTALSEDVDYFTAILIYLGQLLVTGLAVGVVVASLVGAAAATESRFLVAVPVVVALLALLAGAALFFRWRRNPGRRSNDWEAVELVDFEVTSKSPGGLGAELKAAQGRLSRIDAVEAENERLREHVAALTRLLIVKGVLTAEEVAVQIASVSRKVGRTDGLPEDRVDDSPSPVAPPAGVPGASVPGPPAHDV